LFTEEVQKWRLLKKIHHTELVKSVEKVKKNEKFESKKEKIFFRRFGIG